MGGHATIHGASNSETRIGGGVKWIPVKVDSNGNMLTLEQGVVGGERNPDSTTNNYVAVKLEANATRADIGQTETLITASPAYLMGLIPNDANTGYIDVIDAAATGSGNTPVMRVNLSDGGNAGVQFLTGISVRFETGICVDGENAACDVTVLWRPI